MPLFGRGKPIERRDIDKMIEKRDVKGLCKALKDTNVMAGDRGSAAEALGKIGDRRAVEPLIAALKDRNAMVRGEAADALGKIGDIRAVEPLIAALIDTDQNVNKRAADALVKFGNVAVKPLIATVLKDPDWRVRTHANHALVKIGDVAVEPLIAALKDTNNDVRRCAVEALQEIGDIRAVEPLIAALLIDTDQNVRWHVPYALAKIGDRRAVEPLIAALKDRNAMVRGEAADALGKIGDIRAVEPLIAALIDTDQNVNKRAADALVKFGNVVMGPLIVALKDPDWRMRAAASYALCALTWFGDRRAVEPLVAALKDTVSDVRRHAEAALVKIGDVAVEPLIAALKEIDWRVRDNEALVLTLQKFGDLAVKRAVERLLIPALKDEDSDVRMNITKTLYEIDEERTVEQLIAALKDPDDNVRRHATDALVAYVIRRKGWKAIAHTRAIDALCSTVDERAVEPLIAALKDPDDDVRWHVPYALAKIGDRRAVEPLIAALKDRNAMVRGEAADALGKIGDIRAVEPLIAALKDPDYYVRGNAADALGKIGDIRAVEPLIALAQKKGIFRSILYKFNDPRAQEALENLPLICAKCDRQMQRPRSVSLAQPRIMIGTPETLAATPLECTACHLVFCTSCAKRVPRKALGCPICGWDLIDMATRTPVDYHNW